MACPPGPGIDVCLMVFARAAPASGPGTGWNSLHLTLTWRQVKGGKLTSLATLTFRQICVSCIEFEAVPGPKTRTIRVARRQSARR